MTDSIPPDRSIQLNFRRFEFKYVITETKAVEVRDYLSRFLKSDPFSSSSGSYRVTSLYFDSPGLKCYYENEAGLPNRFKIRQRYYNSDPKDAYWEVKRKSDFLVTKSRYSEKSPVGLTVKEISELKSVFHLRPLAYVSYSREAWIQPSGTLRVTFDRDLKVMRAAMNSNQWADFRPIRSNMVIMEVKFTGRIPYLAQRMLQSLSLSRSSVCKYRIAIETAVMLRYSPWVIF